MLARSQEDIDRIHDTLTAVKRLSDGIIKIGPINVVGIDGILSWIPIAGAPINAIYSVLSGLFILLQGVRARCDAGTLFISAIVLMMDSGISAFDGIVPVIPAGSIADTLFQGQLYACHMIQKTIEKTLYVERGEASHAENLAEMRATKGKKRLVYLG
ncbi:DUF4112 domain-containing protein [Asticcacaulis solisilvae]|uniref:DUF4112 domain-containing protein n=1 Tax=Asticcacaulis solisilvae TaxID=1217274 RepID=UPI003FD85CFD